MKAKIEQIIKDLEANACMDKPGGVLEIPLRKVKITLEKHLQEPTEERECENCKKLQKELDGISFSM